MFLGGERHQLSKEQVEIVRTALVSHCSQVKESQGEAASEPVFDTLMQFVSVMNHGDCGSVELVTANYANRDGRWSGKPQVFGVETAGGMKWFATETERREWIEDLPDNFRDQAVLVDQN
jgi:hypothetical protein